MASGSKPSSNGEDGGSKSTWEIPDLNEKSTKTHGVLSKDNWAESIPPTDFTQFFKSFNWSATVLGPLRQWQVALRMHTFVLFGDQRPGCILWFVYRKPTHHVQFLTLSRGPEKVAIYNEAFSNLMVRFRSPVPCIL